MLPEKGVLESMLDERPSPRGSGVTGLQRNAGFRNLAFPSGAYGVKCETE